MFPRLAKSPGVFAKSHSLGLSQDRDNGPRQASGRCVWSSFLGEDSTVAFHISETNHQLPESSATCCPVVWSPLPTSLMPSPARKLCSPSCLSLSLLLSVMLLPKASNPLCSVAFHSSSCPPPPVSSLLSRAPRPQTINVVYPDFTYNPKNTLRHLEAFKIFQWEGQIPKNFELR